MKGNKRRNSVSKRMKLDARIRMDTHRLGWIRGKKVDSSCLKSN